MQAFPFDSKLTYDDHDNPIYDRAVSSQPLRKLIKELFTTGVMPNPSTNLQVSAGSDGMTVQIAAGFAVIDGGLCRETETRTLEVTAADNTYDRIDTVVLRWNENVDVRNADLYVVAGTPAVNPVRPTLQRNNSIYEIGLADVFITKRVATITNDKITDTRYEAERCGIVSSISKFDTTTLYQQIQADLAGFKSTERVNFLTWYESIRKILDENAAGHLQNEIDDLKETVTSAINDLNNDCGLKQNKTDSTLRTTSKTVVGAINELNNDLIELANKKIRTISYNAGSYSGLPSYTAQNDGNVTLVAIASGTFANNGNILINGNIVSSGSTVLDANYSRNDVISFSGGTIGNAYVTFSEEIN